jgi:hypothetical protein
MTHRDSCRDQHGTTVHHGSECAWQKRGQRKPCTHCTCPSSPPSILESDASPHHVGSVSVCDTEWEAPHRVAAVWVGGSGGSGAGPYTPDSPMRLSSLARGPSRANTTACSVSARHRSPTHGQEQQCTRANVLTRWQWFTGHLEPAWCTESPTLDIRPSHAALIPSTADTHHHCRRRYGRRPLKHVHRARHQPV